MRADIRNYIITISIGLLLALVLLFPDYSQLHIKCPFKLLTGLPCPGCGMTRATRHLLRGEIPESLFENPLAIIVDLSIIVAVIWYTIDIIREKKTFTNFCEREWKKSILIPAIIIILAVWAFNLYKHYLL